MANKLETKKKAIVKKTKVVQDSLGQQLKQRNAELAIENARLLDEAKRYSREITTMAEIGREIWASLDLSIVLERIASRALGLLHAHDVVLRLLESDGRLPAAVAIGKYANIYKDWDAHLGQGLSGNVAQTGIAEIINNPENDPRVIDLPGTEQDKTTRAILFAPLLIGESVIGVLSVWRDKVDAGPFTQADLDFGLSLARQAAIAIQNAHLFAESQQRFRETEILLAANVALTKTFDLEIILGTLLDFLHQVVPYDTGSVFLLEGEKHLTARATRGYERWLEDPAQAVGISFEFKNIPHICTVVEDQTTFVIPDVTKYPGWVAAETAGHIRNWLAVPLVAAGKTIGMYSLDKVEPGYFTPEHQRLAENLATQAAIAIQNATLYRNQQAAREQAETLQAVTQSLTRSLNLQEVFDLILTELQKVVPYDSCSVQQLEGEYAIIVGGRGFINLNELIGLRFPTTAGDLSSYVINSRQPHIVDDVSASIQHFRNREHGSGSIHGWMGVPLIFGDRLIGMLTLDKHEAFFYTTEHAKLAMAFAAQAATALENARLFDETQRLLKETQEAKDITETLFAITQVLSKTLSLQDIFEVILTELQRVVPYDSSSVQVIQNNRLVIVGGRGFDDLQALLGVGFDLDDETNPSVQVLRTKRQQVFGDVSRHPHFMSRIHGGGKIRGWIGAPLIFGERVIGVITLDKFEPDFYNEKRAELAMAFAAEAAAAIENARLFETERHARQQAETLRAAALAIGSTLSLREVFELILSELRKVVPYDSCSVQQLDGDTMVIVGGHGFPNLDELLGNRFDWRGQDDPAGDVVRSREPVIIADVSARFEHFKDETHGRGRVHGWLGVPLLFGERLIGMLTLDKLENDFYTPEHAHMAQAFATQAATAIENARLFETERIARQQAETLRAAALALGSTLSLRGVFELILSELRKVVPYDSCSVQQLDGNTMVIVGGHGFPNLDELLGNRFDWRGEDDPAGDVVRRREPVIIADVSARFEHFQEETHGQGRVHGWMGVPLLFGERMIGMLTLDKLEKDFYTAEHAHMAQAFATQAATAIENARLFDETQRLLKITEERAQELAILNSVGEAMAKTFDVKTVTKIVGDKVRDIFQAKGTSILLLDTATNLIHIPYAYFRNYVEVEHKPFTFGKGLASRVIKTGQPLILGTEKEQTKFGAINVTEEMITESYLGVPIIAGEKILGVVSVQSYQQNAYNENHMRLLQTLSSNMGVAIENARLFDEIQRLLKVTEDRAAELSAISKVSQALIVESELDSMIQLIGSQMRELFSADIVYLALLDPQTNLIHFPYQFGESFTTLTLGEGLTSKIIQTGEPLLINSDVNERTLEIGASPVGREALSYLGVPIKTGKGTIGVISVQSTTQEGLFNDDSLRLLTTIAANAGAALHNAQLFSEALENMRQVEILMRAASAIEQSVYEPAMVESVAARTDALGELARVFRNMADEVRLREQRLKRQLAQLQLDIEEKKLAKAETVAIYIPMDRRQAMAQHLSLPEAAHGTALFADVSGFTTLTESLANELGLQRGAEEMIRHLNRVFTALIDEVHRYSGAVISFSGDAITCWFDDLNLNGNPRAESSVERAAACAFAMQQGMTQFAAITTPNGKMIALSIKVALAAGPTRRMTVGDGTPHQIDVLAGATLSALADAEHFANKDEIILSAEGISSLEETFNVSAWREGKQFAVLAGLTKDIAPSAWAPLANDSIPESQLEPWMHPAVFEKVRTGQSEMLSELRPATALFMKFGGLDYDNDPAAGMKLNAFIQWVEGVIAPHNGSIIQFTVGDKGSYIYIVFGAPIAHKDDAAQAVFTALELAAPPESLSYMTDLFIGLASGQMRVGAYGGSSHRTYGAIGDRTNLAARLMVAASLSSVEIPDGQRAIILCNDSIYEAAQAQIEFESIPPINVKGKTEAIEIYRPLRKLVQVDVDSGIALERAQLIDSLSPAQQLTLKVASVIGQLFRFESLSAIYPEEHTHETLQAHLSTLADLDLILKSSLESASYSFKDAQTHEAAYNLMLFAQRRQLHRAVAELLEQTIFNTPPYAEIAHHWQSANEIPKAIEYLEKAGEQARERGDFEEATRFFNESLALNIGG